MIKFHCPSILKDPFGKNSPLGADFFTCSGFTQYALTPYSPSLQALLKQTVACAPSFLLVVGTSLAFFIIKNGEPKISP